MGSVDQAKRVWTLGSYSDIAPNFLPMAAHLVDSAGVASDETVLDIGCGTGNVAITAARRGARITGLDITPAMLDEARKNAMVADVDVVWEEGTATDLPFENDAFDITLSCVGHVFADPPDTAAQELLRVTRSGGTIAFTSWTPTSVVPAMGAVLSDYLPPNPDAPELPFRWGNPETVRERVGDGVNDLQFETGTIQTPVLSPAHYWQAAITQSGMFIVALDGVADTNRKELRAEMIETIERFFDENRNAVPMEYLLSTAVIR